MEEPRSSEGSSHVGGHALHLGDRWGQGSLGLGVFVKSPGARGAQPTRRCSAAGYPGAAPLGAKAAWIDALPTRGALSTVPGFPVQLECGPRWLLPEGPRPASLLAMPPASCACQGPLVAPSYWHPGGVSHSTPHTTLPVAASAWLDQVPRWG